MTKEEQNITVDGELFEKLVVYGANNLKTHLKTVNDLNVFPIPDGDTGENMYKTISGGVSGIKNAKGHNLGEMAESVANGMLLSARGNSGVILSQFFYGIATGLMDCERANVKVLGEAFKRGVKQAYKSVINPVEGTMLTVAREAVEYACEKIDENSTLETFFNDYVKETKRSLERTPELLQVLKEAGVIDSGGAGLMYIAEGMNDAIHGEELAVTEVKEEETTELDFSKFTEDSEMVYGYCTELLLRLQNKKCDAVNFDEKVIIDFLTSIGDSVVCFKTGTIIKLHVHTLTPYKVLEFCQQFGEYLTIKIENMTLQHNETAEEKEKENDEEEISFKVKRARREFALITVATGKGLSDTFLEMGADIVLDGGQGKNPSIEEFINAFDEVNADNIFVLPNNSNIIMAAKQASNIYKGSKIFVIESKNMGQAYSALSMLDYSIGDAEKIADQIREDMSTSVTGMVTVAVRDANIDGVDIKDGNYIGFVDKKMICSNEDKVETALELLDNLIDDEKSFVIAVFGEGATEKEKAVIEKAISSKYGALEYYEIDGKQEVYDFLFIIE